MKAIKRLLAIVLCVMILGGILPSSQTGWLKLPDFSLTASAETYGIYTYQLLIEGDTITVQITDCDESASGDVIIPAKLIGLPVVSIAENAFYNCRSITSIEIPEGIISIAGRPFTYCVSLTDINVDSNNSAFASVDGVLFNKEKTEIIAYPEGKTETDYVIPQGVTSIGKAAFFNCVNLETVEIPKTVSKIGASAFSQCSNLKSIDIPKGVTIINEGAFNKCAALKSVEIPRGVRTIDTSAFRGCSSLESVKIPKEVLTIGFAAFSHCTSLKSIEIPKSVKDIGTQAFYNCYSLANVYYYGSAEEWQKINFYSENEHLTNTTIHFNYPETYMTDIKFKIANDAVTIYAYVGSSAEVTIPSEIEGYPVESIEVAAFRGCQTIKSITIPESVVTIGKNAFTECEALTDVYYTGNEAQRNEISIGAHNEILQNATWHYNYVIPIVSAEVLEGELTGADVKSVTIEPITIYENTFGEALDYSPTEKYYCYCNWTSFLSYKIELENGDTIEAPSGYFRYDDVLYELFAAHLHKEYEERYEVGKTYTEWVRILGEEYPVNITIAPSPVVDIKIDPVIILEGTKCDTFDDYCVYRWYEEMPWKIELNNGKTLESNTQVVIIDDKNYFFEYSDNQDEYTRWKAGETHICRATFLGFSVEIPVTITDTPIKNVEFDEIVLYENADGRLATQYNPEIGRDEEYFKYNWSQYIPYKVTFIDGEELSGVGSGFSFGGEYYPFEWQDTQSLKTKWTVGNSYGQQISVGGKNYTVQIRIEENPVKSVEIANITIPQGMNASFSLEYVPELNEHVEYLRYDLVPFLDYKVTFKDDTFVEATRYGFDYKGRHYGASVQSIQNYKNEWQPDKVYYASISVMGNTNTIPVYIKPIPEAQGFAYTVNNREITIMECYKEDEELIIPETIGEYTVTTIQNLSRTKNFTKLYLPKSIKSLSWIDFTQFENLTTIYYSGNEYDWGYVSKHYNGFSDIEIVFNYSPKQEKAEPPTLLNVIGKTVALTAVSGCEYSMDGVNWQDSNVFADLKCGETYTFYQRFAKTDVNDAGEVSEGFKITMPEHTYNSGVITRKPTCNSTGIKTYTCTVCQATRIATIEKIAHTYKNYLTKATLKKNGSIVNKCSVCGSVYKKTTVYYPKTIKLSATSYTYNGKTKTPTITVKDSKGKTISKSNYTVKYASGRKNVGKYKVTITFKGNYSGTKTLYFNINPVKTSVTKLTAAKKALTVSISKKTKQVTGYEIQYATNKKFSKAKKATIKSYKTTKTTLKKLSAKKTYYVRVRTYKTVGKTKYYSGWSTVKYKKTK